MVRQQGAGGLTEMETELLSDGTVVISENTGFVRYPKLGTSCETCYTLEWVAISFSNA